jgi:hypothetical protein
VAQDNPGNHGLDFSAERVFAFETPHPEPAASATPSVEQKANDVPIRVQVVAKVDRSGEQAMQPPAPKVESGGRASRRKAKLVVRAVQAPAQKLKAGLKTLEGNEFKAPLAVKPPQIAAALEANKPTPVDLTVQVLSESPQPPLPSKPLPSRRELKSAAELAAMIELDLQHHPRSPGKGLRVTVYGGADSWRAMLTILPAAGPVRDPQGLRDLTDELAERLLRRYDLAWE